MAFSINSNFKNKLNQQLEEDKKASKVTKVTKAGKRFWLLPWQEQIVRDVFGIVDENGNRQFRTAFVEIGKKNGKSELAAAIALFSALLAIR